jgi:glucans biosynthesis protein
MKRRDLLRASGSMLAALPLRRGIAVATAGADDPARPFDHERVKAAARALAAKPYVPDATRIPPALAKISWDAYQSIGFRASRALWAHEGLPFRIRFFHLGMQFRRAVRMHEVVDGVAREIVYDASMFDLARSGQNEATLPHGLGFAGFRLFFAPDFERDVAAFLGASYFRAVGATKQYGLSARGLAVDCGLPRAEEFPDFVAFWFERPKPGAKALVVHALLDSPSIAGAYRFEIAPGEPLVMHVEATWYPRAAIERLGIAPLTSMFLVAPYDRRVDTDWRPVIHDSDGLAMHAGSGEWLWRPLANPSVVRVSTFRDAKPKGFGLFQRDRNFDHYQDDGAWYDRRPSLWVEPLSGFENGAVTLLEIPAEHESADNIAAFWNPASAPKPGAELHCAYRLHWGEKMPDMPPLATAAMTWSGIGGQAGGARAHFSWRFVVDFAGGELALLAKDTNVEAVVTLSRGTAEFVSARPLDAIHGWRAMFDVRPPDAGTQPIDIRLFLRLRERALTGTWLYQWTPPERPAAS